MSTFSIKRIVNGNTIQVTNSWIWADKKGSYVRILGYDINSQNDGFAAGKLRTLFGENAAIELKNPKKVEGAGLMLLGSLDAPPDNILYCSVYLNEVDIAQYFPELKTPD